LSGDFSAPDGKTGCARELQTLIARIAKEREEVDRRRKLIHRTIWVSEFGRKKRLLPRESI
jgi:hypothetical protein